MSIVAVLYDLMDLPEEENMNAIIEITNQLLNEYRNVYRPGESIDEHVNGELVAFANNIDGLPLLNDVDNAFPGMKEYVFHHVIDGLGHWDDWNYCSWVSSGMLRFLGRDLAPPSFPLSLSLGRFEGDGYPDEPIG